ncbi:MAG: hypothetical protein AAB250_18075, partial [Bdellovibrionota bacterium]
GVLPLELATKDGWRLSLNLLSGADSFQAAVFVIAILATISFIVQLKPLTSSLVMWLTGVSILSRNELVLNGADHYFAMLLTWNALLAWSRSRGVAIGYTWQIAVLYFSTGLAKSAFEPWRDGTAMRDILNLDILTRPWSQALAENPMLMASATYATIAIEFLAPFGLIAGTLWPRIRSVTLISLAGLHVGIIALLKLYLIPVMSLVSLLPFIPSTWWTRSPRNTPTDRDSLSPAIAAACVCFVITSTVASNLPSQRIPLPNWIKSAAIGVRLDQDWAFYAPPPTPGYDGWWGVDGTTVDGTHVDVWSKKTTSPSYEKPDPYSAFYPNQHWTAYFMNLAARDEIGTYVQALGRYLCREWNASGNVALARIAIERRSTIDDRNPMPDRTFTV